MLDLKTENGYTIVVYLPPEAGPELTEAVFDAVGEVVGEVTKDRGYWDPYVGGYAGDQFGIDDDPQDWPVSVANPKRTRVV